MVGIVSSWRHYGEETLNRACVTEAFSIAVGEVV
jgi:hypothetical protein